VDDDGVRGPVHPVERGQHDHRGAPAGAILGGGQVACRDGFERVSFAAPRSGVERWHHDHDVTDPTRGHARPDDVARSGREEAHRVVRLVHEERERGPGLESRDRLVREDERSGLVLGDERVLAVPRERRAREHRERERGGHDDGERPTPLEPAPQADESEGGQDRDREPERHEPIGGKPSGHEPDRHAGEREDEPRAQDPAGVAVPRREADRGERHRDPFHVTGPAVDEAVEVRAPQLGREAGPPQERVLRRVDLQGWCSRPHGQQPDPERCGAAGGGPRDPERLAPIVAPGEGGRDEQDRDAQQEELWVGQAAPGEHDRGQHCRPASGVVQQRAGSEERRRGDQVGDVPGREVDGEPAGSNDGRVRVAGGEANADVGATLADVDECDDPGA